MAGPRGEFDWIVHEPAIDFKALFAEFDTFIVGRRTFELMLRLEVPRGRLTPGPSYFPEPCPTPFPFRPPKSFARSRPRPWRPSRSRRRRTSGCSAVASCFAASSRAGLVDTVEVAVIPILLGQGLPLLPQTGTRARLLLSNHRIYPSGIVYLEYACHSQ
jgi:dihydrofolate reductase